MNPMSRPLTNLRPVCRQRGQSMIEYTIIAAGLALLLFAATPVGQQLAQAVRTFYADLTLFLSLP
jgi:Flp pilus assembly pilin Flp